MDRLTTSTAGRTRNGTNTGWAAPPLSGPSPATASSRATHADDSPPSIKGRFAHMPFVAEVAEVADGPSAAPPLAQQPPEPFHAPSRRLPACLAEPWLCPPQSVTRALQDAVRRTGRTILLPACHGHSIHAGDSCRLLKMLLNFYKVQYVASVPKRRIGLRYAWRRATMQGLDPRA